MTDHGHGGSAASSVKAPARPMDLFSRLDGEFPRPGETVRMTIVGRPAGAMGHAAQRAIATSSTFILIVVPLACLQRLSGTVVFVGLVAAAWMWVLVPVLQRMIAGTPPPRWLGVMATDERVLIARADRPDAPHMEAELPADAVTSVVVDEANTFLVHGGIARITLLGARGEVAAIDLGRIDRSVLRAALDEEGIPVVAPPGATASHDERDRRELPWLVRTFGLVIGALLGLLSAVAVIGYLSDGEPVAAGVSLLLATALLGGTVLLLRKTRS